MSRAHYIVPQYWCLYPEFTFREGVSMKHAMSRTTRVVVITAACESSAIRGPMIESHLR